MCVPARMRYLGRRASWEDGVGDDRLQNHFATLYVTYYSIVIALVAERLLSHLDGLGVLWGDISSVTALIWVQALVIVVVAGNSWYITVHWVFERPWRFGYFDAIGPLLTLVIISLAIEPIGRDAGAFFVRYGFYSLTGLSIYLINSGRSMGRAKMRTMLQRNVGRLVGAAMIGVVPILVGTFANLSEWPPGVLLAATAGLLGLTISLAVLDRLAAREED